MYNDESLIDFLRVSNDYINQIKLTVFEIYASKESKTSQQRSSLSIKVHLRLENCNCPNGFLITQSSDFSNINQ